MSREIRYIRRRNAVGFAINVNFLEFGNIGAQTLRKYFKVIEIYVSTLISKSSKSQPFA